MKMEKLKRSLSFRKKKDHVPECSKPHQWQEDEKKVRDGTCSFQVRYLGCIEVFESRGMQVCEEAVKALKSNCKGKYQRAILYVSGDALRVVDEISKSMIVDQTIEKVSFCAPDRSLEKGFAYICRDGTTRRWMCHGFMAVKESGERLSHAVGCAFAICLERKQKRDKVSEVTVTYNPERTSFARTGSFRQTTMTERIADPQSAIIAEPPIPVRISENPYAVQRPHASANALQRQGSFRGFSKLNEASSPFKRTLSLRLSDLPSTLQRQNAILESPERVQGGVGSPIQEVSPSHEQQSQDSISQMCQQLTQGLSALSTDDPFAAAPRSSASSVNSARLYSPTHSTSAAYQQRQINMQGHMAPRDVPQNYMSPVRDTNPWSQNAQTTTSTARVSNADFWLQSTTSPQSSTNPFASPPGSAPVPGSVNGTTSHYPGYQRNISMGGQPAVPQRTNFSHIQHTRSHSIDTSELAMPGWQGQQSQRPTLLQMANQRSFQQNGTPSSRQQNITSPSQQQGVDPFDVAWAAKSANKQNTNPFSNAKNVKTFEVQL